MIIVKPSTSVVNVVAPRKIGMSVSEIVKPSTSVVVVAPRKIGMSVSDNS